MICVYFIKYSMGTFVFSQHSLMDMCHPHTEVIEYPELFKMTQKELAFKAKQTL